jgi:hypothetical protein
MKKLLLASIIAAGVFENAYATDYSIQIDNQSNYPMYIDGYYAPKATFKKPMWTKVEPSQAQVPGSSAVRVPANTVVTLSGMEAEDGKAYDSYIFYRLTLHDRTQDLPNKLAYRHVLLGLWAFHDRWTDFTDKTAYGYNIGASQAKGGENNEHNGWEDSVKYSGSAYPKLARMNITVLANGDFITSFGVGTIGWDPSVPQGHGVSDKPAIIAPTQLPPIEYFPMTGVEPQTTTPLTINTPLNSKAKQNVNAFPAIAKSGVLPW